MKKLILTLIAACAIAFSANAQFYATGSLGFDLYSAEGVSASTWHVAPGIGYSFGQRSSAGLDLMLGGAGSGFQWSVMPYYRLAFGNAKGFHFFAEALGKIGMASKVTVWGIGIVPGVSFPVSSKVSIVSRIGYLGVEGVSKSVAFRFNALENVSIGVQIRL